MSRGDVSVAMLVSIAALMAFLVVSLVIVWPVLRDAIFGAGEGSQCQFSLLLSSMTQRNIFKLTDLTLPPECKVKRMTVTKADLAKHHAEAEQAISGLLDSGDPSLLGDFSSDERGFDKWAMSKILADELVECHNRASLGSQQIVDGLVSSMVSVVGLPQYGGNAFVCLLCARVSVDAEVAQSLGPSTFSTWSWLLKTKYKEGTYADYLLDRSSAVFYGTWLRETSGFRVGEPYVVMFAAKTTYGSGSANVGSVGLYPYQTLTSDLGQGLPVNALESLNLRREKIAGISAPTSKCAVIIGD